MNVFIVRAAGLSLAQCQKREILLSLQNRGDKVEEYEAMEKLIVFIPSRDITKFKQELFLKITL